MEIILEKDFEIYDYSLNKTFLFYLFKADSAARISSDFAWNMLRIYTNCIYIKNIYRKLVQFVHELLLSLTTH